MSTKTSFKRVALVAVAALGFGMLSAAPSSATVIANSLTIDAGTDSITLGESATAVMSHSFVATAVTDSVTITAIKTSSNSANAGSIRINLTESSTSATSTAGVAATSPGYSHSTGVNSALALLTDTGASRPDSFTVQGTSGANRSNFTKFTATLYNPTAAGTYEIKFYMTTQSGGSSTQTPDTTVVTWTVTVAAPDRASTAASTSTLREGVKTIAQGKAEGVDSIVAASRTALATDLAQEATIYVIEKTATLTAGNDSLTVIATGEAFVSDNLTARGVSKAITVAHSAAAQAAGTGTPIYVWATGTAGTATITISTIGGLLLGTETVRFYGSAASIAVDTAYATIGRANGFSLADAFDIVVKDSISSLVLGADVTMTSSNPAAVSSGSCADAYLGVSDGYYTCEFTSTVGSKSGDKATLTFRVPVPSSSPTTYYTVTADVTLGGSVATEVITLHDDKLALKSTFSPGEGMVIAITAKDSSGNPVYDGAATPSLTANKVLGGLGSLGSGSYIGGQYLSRTMSGTTVLMAYNIFAPASSGSFTLSGLSGNATASLISVTATVTDDASVAAAKAAGEVAQSAIDAAAEATDAANAATDAANAAAEAADAATAAAQDAADAVAALSAQVATLISGLKAQLTSLTNLIIKIQKKVKA